MTWYLALLAALSGGLAAIISILIFGRRKASTWLSATSTAILFVGFMYVSHQFVAPHIEKHLFSQQLEVSFADIPVYQTLNTQEPKVYQEMLATLKSEREKGASEKEISAILHKKITTLTVERTPHANEQALLGFLNATINQLEHLAGEDPLLCYQQLFPETGGVNISEHLPEDIRQQELAALDAVLKTSTEQKQIPEQAEVMPIIKTLYRELYAEFGSSMAFMQTPTAPEVDKQQVCLITLNLYKKIAALPQEEAIPTLRWMFANS